MHKSEILKLLSSEEEKKVRKKEKWVVHYYNVMKYSHRVVSHFGGAENLILVVEDKLPEPRANEVRVKIHYIELFSYPRYIMKAATILSCILLIIKNQSKDNG